MSDQERAQLLSMPYLSGSTRATDADRGVTAWSEEHSWGTHNLYTSGHGPDAILIRSDGTPVHRWRMPFERAFPDRPPSIETSFFRRAHLLPEGDLLAIYQGGGMVRLNRRSEIVWAVAGSFFNDFFVRPNGDVWAITKEAKRIPEINPEADILEDKLIRLDSAGALQEELSILDALRASKFSVLESMADQGDILHSNTVQELTGQLHAPFEPGHLLLSMREISTLAVLDPKTRDIVWAQRGPWSRQHEPTLTARGGILLFDNQGGANGRARILETNPDTGELLYEQDGFVSPEAGTVAALPNGNLLITESERGRAVELTPNGEVAWEFRSPHRAGRDNNLVATLFEVVRLGAGAAGDLDDGS